MFSNAVLLMAVACAVLIFRNCSLYAGLLESKGLTNTPAYVCTLGGVFGSLFLGVEGLYRLYIRAEKTVRRYYSEKS